MMRSTTTILFAALFALFGTTAQAQTADFIFEVPLSDEFDAPYTPGTQSGARGVSGPYDLDGDGREEVLVTDYTRGGRVHVIENTGVDAWEHVYSTPALDSTASTSNARIAVGGDLDGDGKGEIIFPTGSGFSTFNPNITVLPRGIYVFEYSGTGNNYGDMPASIYTGNADPPDRFLTERLEIGDFDQDGQQELAFANNGANSRFDTWYILSVEGDIGSGFEVWTEEARLSSRASEDYDPVNRGGGSPTSIHFGDFNGDGQTDISMHAWNAFDFTNGTIPSADTYVFPGAEDDSVFFQASAPADNVSLFGGVVADIDQDGNDEVFYPEFQTGNVSVLNYDEGESVLVISDDNLIRPVVLDLTTLGITAGNIDGDAQPELIGSGPSYTPGQFEAGLLPGFIRVAHFEGENVEDSTNYEVVTLRAGEDFDTLATQFDLVRRDSAGVITEFLRDTGATPRGDRPRGQGPLFISKLAYLGDVDGDGDVEVAAAFQGNDDSTYVIQETFNPADSTYTQEIVEVRPNEHRAFMRILSFDVTGVAAEGERGVAKSVRLSANHPNPFSRSTGFTFTLREAGPVTVKVYDLTGRLVKTLVSNQLYTAGTHPLHWDGTDSQGARVASGLYVYSLEAGGTRTSRSMVVVR